MSPAPQKPVDLYRRLLAYSLKYWPLLVAALVSLVFAAVTEPLFARLMKPLIDDNFSATRTSTAKWLPLIIVALFLVRGLATYINEYCSAKLAGLVVVDLRFDMLSRILRFPNSYFVEQPAGKVISTVSTNVDMVTEAGFNIITVAIRDGAIVIGLMAMLLYTNWQLTLVCIAIVPLIAIGVSVAAKRLNRFAHSAQTSHADLVQSISEVINAQKIIKIYGAHRVETDRFMKSADDIRQSRVKLVATSAANSAIVQWILAVAVAFVVFFAGKLASKNAMTAGDFASFMTAMMMLLTPVKRLTNINQQLQKGLAAADNVFRVVDRAIETSQGTHTTERAKGVIEFDGVGLQYPGTDVPTLKRIDLTVQPGQTVGIVGVSGGGKSTLINLLPRFLDPTSGEVRLDGVPLKQWDLESLRRQIAIVTQESHLLNDTVRHNIAYGEMRQASEEAIVEAAKMANAWPFIQKLDNGLDTVLGDNGLRLSGGQRQRISIARAFLKNAPILILDEATSALDSEAEREVQDDMERLRHGRTTLVIAHRLSTLVTADFIVVIEQGEIIERGTHLELLALKGRYHYLHSIQNVEAVS
ncbi:lipid A export permease/ATP-binding protein MsbA [Limnobacter litoralis]|uniref:Lipid A export ATP-binding/permease protein MsbA n=2 Tax=Limnobacter TaxID=131079 RepID=A0ABQ5YLT7_9BURK|nr:lipid A export permease/ATP-binding protein MsbA [Limnobacter litoralis]GLR24916.1 lipid A export ATP-binding/permease protein MsbA [Limnobacter litoralis]